MIASPSVRGTSSLPPRPRCALRLAKAPTILRSPSCCALDDAAFRLRFAGTPVKRTGRNRVVRNALIAAGNSGDKSLLPLIVPLLEDASPLVRAMAVWASRRLDERSRIGAVEKPLRAARSRSRRGRRMDRYLRRTMPHEPAFLLWPRLLRHRARDGASWQQGWTVSGTATHAEKAERLTRAGLSGLRFRWKAHDPADVADALRSATHVLLSIPPGADGDPALRCLRRRHRGEPVDLVDRILLVRQRLRRHARRMGRRGAPRPNPESERGVSVASKPKTAGWNSDRRAARRSSILRLPGIYGPGRSAIDQLRAGKARRIFKPGQVTNRVHVDDIATAIEAALQLPSGIHVFNVTDDLPAPPQDVIAYGAELLGVALSRRQPTRPMPA